ncbi:MAG TPA: hypothetical protein VF957_07455 [Bradyrhizobium sp.]
MLLRASVRKRISGYRANRPFPRAIKCHAVKLFHAFKDDETILWRRRSSFPEPTKRARSKRLLSTFSINRAAGRGHSSLFGVIWLTGAARFAELRLNLPLFLGGEPWGSKMAAIAKLVAQVSGTEVEIDGLKTVAIFCGVGLFVSLLLATYGLDLSGGFF